MSDPYKKQYPVRETRKNPQRYLAHPSTGTRANLKDYLQQVTIRKGLTVHRKSKKNPHIHGGRRHRKHRSTRRR